MALTRLVVRQRHRIVELGKFGSVGLVGFVIDVAVFNLLLFTLVDDAPWVSKAVSTVVSGTVCYVLNRHWTWSHRERRGAQRELPAFLVVSALGLAIAEACLLASHFGLGLTSRLADNISANGAGLALATLFRFWAYKRFVFLEQVEGPDEDAGHRRDDRRPAVRARSTRDAVV
jgi:putative flippase GtrA